MLRSVNGLRGYVLAAQDGEIGRCNDFLFDDRFWTVRYMVAYTGKWLPKRKVLISPISLGEPDWESQQFSVNLTKKEVEDSPPLDEGAPVSREYEMRWLDHYGWSYYWFGGGLWGPAADPTGLYVKGEKERIADKDTEPPESYLRSAEEVAGYHIQAIDDEIGHVDDFILDDKTWTIRYMVVDTRNWLPGRKVLVTPDWIDSVDWVEDKVSLDLTREQVKNSPEYHPKEPVNREYEARLYDYYGRPRYWDG